MRSVTLILLVACGAPDDKAAPPDPCDQPGAPVLCVQKTMDDQHYIQQSHAYFDTMDYEPVTSIEPDYAEAAVRYEWAPWLLLTGFGGEEIKAVDAALAALPSVVKERDCRAFDENPFGRCYITFYYDDHEGRPCPIYEEFSFDENGQILWIEAWSNIDSYLPMDPSDTWGEGAGNTRLSARIPGLGLPQPLDIYSDAMASAAAADPEVADFVERATDWKSAWGELIGQTDQDQMWAEGCGWMANGTAY